ncbi:hypothetical protein PHYC_02032 [Phycisphaerales bacterium]|nr:hypothetical protein PHYC_02032 [Phycisphaerales bacterium]
MRAARKHKSVDFGDVFDAGRADPGALERTVQAVMVAEGFLVSRTTVAEGVIQVDGEQKAPRSRIVLEALPQRLRWTIRRSDAGGTLHFDRWCESWYRVFCAGLCAIAATLTQTSFFVATRLDGGIAIVGGVGLFVGMSLLFVAWRACSAGTGRVERLLESLHTSLRREGIRLDHRPEASNNRLYRTAWRFMIYLLTTSSLLVVAALASSPALKSSPKWLVPAFLLLGGLAVILMLTLLKSTRKPGFEQRLRVTLPGVSGLLLVVFFLAAQFPGHVVAALDSESWYAMFAARDLLESAPLAATTVTGPNGKPVDVQELRSAVTTVKFMITAGLLVTPMVWGLGLLCLYPTLKSLDLILRHSRRLADAADLVTARKAMSGEGFIQRFRFNLISIWFLAALANLWGGTALVRAGWNAAFGQPGGWTQHGGDIAGATGLALNFALHQPLHSLVGAVASRLFWASWAFLLVCLVAASIFDWYLKRHRVLRLLRACSKLGGAAPEHSAAWAPIASILHEAAHSIHLAVVRSEYPTAAAHQFGVFRRERFVAISTKTCEILDQEEMRALLSHECAHLLLGHCWRHNACQLAGRLTLAGDAFVGALEGSYGYELAADRAAVGRFRADGAALARCLQKLRAVAVMTRWQRTSGAQGLGVLGRFCTASPQRPGRGTWVGRLRDAVRLWARLYSGDSEFAYWHPAIDRRITALSALDSQVADR